ncbi:uncharacterized protein LOC123011011 [Tribolium madens]|uniref:uncharacterized protein LOC123011011 n=1 Tax=Tribolium madens TaxID=41895 RepID=UPI001CF73BFE|nr:uncharacterized protein LOC123011011 [Tribolium madens]
MLRFTFLLFVFLLSISRQCICLQDYYYWRDYTNGEVPIDAVIGGKIEDGRNVYIGQAYIQNQGEVVCEIFDGVREVYVPIRNDIVQKVEENIRILCGPQQNLYWVPTDSKNVHKLLVNNIGVRGGHEDGDGEINIGRININGGFKIGKIDTYYESDVPMFYNNNLKEESAMSYEILLYKKHNAMGKIIANKEM